jgi:leader peptidase (prepilin peptidase)/N-methyltransferase
MLTVILFLYGLIFGSFFNVAGYRIPQQMSILTPRSSCPLCSKTLSASELIPVLSYMIQRRRCNSCGNAIPPFYARIELFTAFLFAWAGYRMGWSAELLAALLLISLLMIIFVTDSLYMLIPNRILLFFLPLFLGARVFSPLDPWYDCVAGGLTGFVLLFFLAVISRGGMGGGDIKLFGLLGIVLGWKLVLLSFFLSCLIGAIDGLCRIARRKGERNEPFPFGPSIVIASLASYFFGKPIMDWYFQTIGL